MLQLRACIWLRFHQWITKKLESDKLDLFHSKLLNLSVIKEPTVNSIMEEIEPDLRRSVQAYGVQKDIVNILFSVFPNDSFKEHLSTFKKAVNQPSNMSEFIFKLGIQLGLGVTSHIATAAREFLLLPNFPMFTRDYMKRCCDLVEHAIKLFTARQIFDLFLQLVLKPWINR